MSDQLLQQILEKLTQMDSRISNIENNMATKEDVAELPWIKTAIHEIVENQEKQKRILETLSIRSVEHEADIAAIKRVKQ